LKDTTRQLTAAFDLIHHADPSSSLSKIMLWLHHTQHRPTHPQSAMSLQFTRVRFNDPAAVAYRTHHWSGWPVAWPVGQWNFQWYRFRTQNFINMRSLAMI